MTKLFALLPLLVASTFATSSFERFQCFELKRFESLEKLVANQTELDEITNRNASTEDAFKAKAKEIQSKIDALKANATLVADCQKIFAVIDMETQCDKISLLERLEKIASNQTLLDEVTQKNSTMEDTIKAKAKEEQPVLKALKANVTLTSFCDNQRIMGECMWVAELQQATAWSKNQSWLDQKFGGNTQKEEAFKAELQKLRPTLEALQANKTLMDRCKKIQSTSGDSNPANPSTGKSIAASYQPVTTLSLAAALFASVLLL